MKEKIARFYSMHIYTKDNVAMFVRKGVLTADEYEEITGEAYEE